MDSTNNKGDCCCICFRFTERNNIFFQPARCFRIEEFHKICKECWFCPNGFAEEDGDHRCPGCLSESESK